MRRKNRPYRIFIAYQFKNGLNHGFGNYTGFEAARKNISIKDVRAMEEAIRKKYNYTSVVIMNYRFMEDRG